MQRRAAVVIAGIVAVVTPGLVSASSSAVASRAPAAAVHQRTTCQQFRFDTDEHRFRAGFDNQGVAFIDTSGSGINDLDWYGVGFEYEAPYVNHDWFTFQLGALP